jgi:hypothetical protein
MVNKIDDLGNIWIPGVFPRGEATNAISSNVVTTLIRRNTRFKNASSRNTLVAKVLDPDLEQADRFFDLAFQSVFAMSDPTLLIMPQLVQLSANNVDGSIIVEVVKESIQLISRPYRLKPPDPNKGSSIS